MQTTLGSYEFYIGSDYVIRPERRRFKRFEKTVTSSGLSHYEGIFFGVLVLISAVAVRTIYKQLISDDDDEECSKNENTSTG